MDTFKAWKWTLWQIFSSKGNLYQGLRRDHIV